jgi:hypothetical protein
LASSLAGVAAQPKIPDWLVLGPGRSAYLKEDGRVSQNATVCDTVEAYLAFANGRSKQGCHSHERGELVTITRIAGSNDQYGTITPVVEIHSGEADWTGMIDATLLRPIVPPHTILETQVLVDYPPQVWSTREDSKDNEIAEAAFPHGTAYFPAHSLVELERQEPYARNADMYVRGISGRGRGLQGWMIQLFIPHTQVAVDDFMFPVRSSL